MNRDVPEVSYSRILVFGSTMIAHGAKIIRLAATGYVVTHNVVWTAASWTTRKDIANHCRGWLGVAYGIFVIPELVYQISAATIIGENECRSW